MKRIVKFIPSVLFIVSSLFLAFFDVFDVHLARKSRGTSDVK